MSASLTKGQVAMTATRMRFVSNQTQRQTAALTKVSQRRISFANVVLQFAPELADEVMFAATPLDAVYATTPSCALRRPATLASRS
jgi:hypothetical protein